MRVRWLGWAGVEVQAQEATVVIDPLAEPAATFAALGDRADRTPLPQVVAPEAGRAVAGLVTHLHRDHADAGALEQALAPGAAVRHPRWPGGADEENLALAQAAWELGRTDLEREEVDPWDRFEAGPFTIAAVPAVDGLGDPQVSWVVEADGRRLLHLGDTRFHGYWWRIARRHGPFDLVMAPVNAAAVDFPHLRPPSPLAATLGPEEAAVATELLGAPLLVPMHYGGYAIEPWYRPQEDLLSRLEAACDDRPFDLRALEPGESVELGATVPAA